MNAQLIQRRQAAADRHDRARARFPNRTGPEFQAEILAVINELTAISGLASTQNGDKRERGITSYWTGLAFMDLADATSDDFQKMVYLQTALGSYQVAEQLLGDEVSSTAAKIQVHIGSAFQNLSGGTDAGKLAQAKAHYEKAFQIAQQTDAALAQQVTGLITSVKQMQMLSGMLSTADTQIDALMAELNASHVEPESKTEPKPEPKSESEPKPENHALQDLFGQLKDEVEKDKEAGKVDAGKMPQLDAMMKQLQEMVDGYSGEDLESTLSGGGDVREKMQGMLSSIRNPSYGKEGPSSESRNAQVHALWMELKVAVGQDAMAFGGEKENKERIGLYRDVAAAGTAINATGDDAPALRQLEQHSLRVLALRARQFLLRKHLMYARPVWQTPLQATDANFVFYIGDAAVEKTLAAACLFSGRTLSEPVAGENIAELRWAQMGKASICVFDMTAAADRRAEICYALGIARTLGKPCIVVATPGQRLPFDIDEVPLRLQGDAQDTQRIAEALTQADFAPVRPANDASVDATVAFLKARFGAASAFSGVQAGLLQPGMDPIELKSVARSLLATVGTQGHALIQPPWKPAYPAAGRKQLFHVMPFGKAWSSRVREQVRATCTRHAVHYVRGDEAEGQEIIRSIWDEICLATHVLVDLTDFNENVALELGMAHALGKQVLIVLQEGTDRRKFPMLAKYRTLRYGANGEGLSEMIEKFII